MRAVGLFKLHHGVTFPILNLYQINLLRMFGGANRMSQIELKGLTKLNLVVMRRTRTSGIEKEIEIKTEIGIVEGTKTVEETGTVEQTSLDILVPTVYILDPSMEIETEIGSMIGVEAIGIKIVIDRRIRIMRGRGRRELTMDRVRKTGIVSIAAEIERKTKIENGGELTRLRKENVEIGLRIAIGRREIDRLEKGKRNGMEIEKKRGQREMRARMVIEEKKRKETKT
jgi:hypothetical protein